MTNELEQEAIKIMKSDGMNVLYCSHVNKLKDAPPCCESCHEDEDDGYDNLYNEIDGLKYNLCCVKRIYLFGD